MKLPIHIKINLTDGAAPIKARTDGTMLLMTDSKPMQIGRFSLKGQVGEFAGMLPPDVAAELVATIVSRGLATDALESMNVPEFVGTVIDVFGDGAAKEMANAIMYQSQTLVYYLKGNMSRQTRSVS